MIFFGKELKLSSCVNLRGRAVIPPLATVYALGALIFAVTLFFLDQIDQVTRDHGPIQIANVSLLLGLCGLAAFRTWANPGQRIDLGLLTYGMLFYAAREADLHNLDYYPEHLANRRFYSSAEIPVLDRVLIGLLLLTLVIAAGTLLVRVAPSLLKALRRCDGWAVYTVFWFVTIVLTQISDHSDLNDALYGQALEEVGELTAGGIAALIVWYFPADGGRSSADES
jgi:hypothetical protein